MRRWGLLSVLALSFVCYYGVWNYGFASDDVAFVDRFLTHGPRALVPYLDPSTGSGRSDAYARGYRPAWILSLYGDYLLGETSPGGYHLTNLLVFLITVGLVWSLAAQVTGDNRTALWASALFAVHPIHTLTTIWISGRTDGISTLGVLGALLAVVTWQRSGRIRWLIGALALGVLGLAAKEMGYLLPPLVVLTEWVRRSVRREEHPVRDALRASIPFWLLAGIWGGVVTLSGSLLGGYIWRASVGDVLVNWTGALALLFYPFDYEPLVRFWLAHRTYLVPAEILAFGIAAFVLYRAWKVLPIRWGALWVGITLLPLYRLTMRWYLLLPSVGACIALGYAVRVLERKIASSRTIRGIPLRYGTVLGVLLLLPYLVGLVGERTKWARADVLTRRSLASLVEYLEATPSSKDLIVTVSPAKLDRMPVFGGNLESFLHVVAKRDIRVSVIGLAALGRADGPITCRRIGDDSLFLAIPPGDGYFIPVYDRLVMLRRRQIAVGDSFATDVGWARVVAVNRFMQPIALDAGYGIAAVKGARWVHFSKGRFSAFTPASSRKL